MNDHTARQAVCPSGQDGHHRSQSTMHAVALLLVVFLIKRLGSTRIIVSTSANYRTVFQPFSNRSFTVFLVSGNRRTHCRTETVRSVL